MKNFRTFKDPAGATRPDSILTMKKGLKYALAVCLLMAVFHGGAGVLFAQSGAEGSFKKLLLLKFDSSKDGSLTGLEKTNAVKFLNGMDIDKDGQISLAERSLAITALNEMRDQGKKVVTKNMTPADRNEAKRDASWGEFLKKLPHSTEGRTFTSMPGDKGFKMKGDAFVDSTKIKGVAPGGDRVTAAQLDKQMADLIASSKRRRHQKGVAPLKKETKPVTALKKRDYYAGTTILVSGPDHTVVPEGSVLSLPVNMSKMVSKKPVGTLVMWPVFIKKYYRQFTTKEVSWETAKGEDPISEKERKLLTMGGKVVVAVYKKNPISVIEPPAEEEGAVKGSKVTKTTANRR